MFGDCVPQTHGRAAYMAALTLRTTSLAKAAAALERGGIQGVVKQSERLVVPARAAYNATLEFIA